MTHELLTQKAEELSCALEECKAHNTSFQDQIVLMSTEKKDLMEKEFHLIEINLE